ncbi:DNA-invertase hin [Calidithermus terrae]|uniref:DNA-invertase hin n=1 Tax=Calidithermus terrae TaxID=1408545 RepID=A0A399EQ93_9DEIN|nr:recombinase family protein [Calidithermus terrae]RIH84722.1 DNA-invertase hin [Calidithermus terrae]
MTYGYARVSTKDQDPSAQVAALEAAGCHEVVTEHASSRLWERPLLQGLLGRLQPGDTLTVWRLDRLVGPVEHLERAVQLLEARGCTLRSLNEHIDTSNAVGRMFVQFMGVLNEYRLNYMRENTLLGLEQARAQGRRLGRRPKLSEPQQRAALEMVAAGRSRAEVARLFGVDAATVARLVRRYRHSE